MTSVECHLFGLFLGVTLAAPICGGCVWYAKRESDRLIAERKEAFRRIDERYRRGMEQLFLLRIEHGCLKEDGRFADLEKAVRRRDEIRRARATNLN